MRGSGNKQPQSPKPVDYFTEPEPALPPEDMTNAADRQSGLSRAEIAVRGAILLTTGAQPLLPQAALPQQPQHELHITAEAAPAIPKAPTVHSRQAGQSEPTPPVIPERPAANIFPRKLLEAQPVLPPKPEQVKLVELLAAQTPVPPPPRPVVRSAPTEASRVPQIPPQPQLPQEGQVVPLKAEMSAVHYASPALSDAPKPLPQAPEVHLDMQSTVHYEAASVAVTPEMDKASLAVGPAEATIFPNVTTTVYDSTVINGPDSGVVTPSAEVRAANPVLTAPIMKAIKASPSLEPNRLSSGIGRRSQQNKTDVSNGGGVVTANKQSAPPAAPEAARPKGETYQDKVTKLISAWQSFAWPSSGHGKTPTQAYVDAVSKFNGSKGQDLYTDCGVATATGARMSVDSDYPVRGTAVQMEYLEGKGAAKWDNIGPASMEKLQPGDYLLWDIGSDGHTFIYTGPQPNGMNAMSASWHGHAPEAISIDDAFLHSKPYKIYRIKGDAALASIAQPLVPLQGNEPKVAADNSVVTNDTVPRIVPNISGGMVDGVASHPSISAGLTVALNAPVILPSTAPASPIFPAADSGSTNGAEVTPTSPTVQAPPPVAQTPPTTSTSAGTSTESAPAPKPAETASEALQNIPTTHRQYFIDAGKAFNVPPEYVAILFLNEHSNYWAPLNSHWASSPAGAQGPMQFLRPTFNEYKTSPNADINDFRDSIMAAANMMSRNGVTVDTPLGSLDTPYMPGTFLGFATRYNAGQGTLNRFGVTDNSPLSQGPAETQHYAQNAAALGGSNLTRGAMVRGYMENPHT